MQYTVTYRQIPRSPSLEERLGQALDRFAGPAKIAHVVFSREGRSASVSCHLTGPRLDLVVKEKGYDLYSALDHVGQRLRKIRKARMLKAFRRRAYAG